MCKVYEGVDIGQAAERGREGRGRDGVIVYEERSEKISSKQVMFGRKKIC